MRKNLFIILMVCLAVVGLVSCKNEIEPAQEELVYVSFENGTSRALTATLETFNPNNYWWSYEAQKNDGSGLLSGETAWNETGIGALPVQSGQGLDVSANNPVQVPGFSKGYWNFRLFAYKNSARTQLAYWGEADAVRIDNAHHTASVTVSPVAGDSGYLKVGTITFNPASAISGPTDLVVFEDTVSLKVGDGWKAIKWDEVPPYYMDGEDKHILPAAGYAYDSTTDTYTLPSGQYLFTRTYSYEGISVASGSVLATVYSNLTTTVSGSISELTSYAQFEAIQNPDAVNVSAEATGIKYDDLTKTSGYDLTDSENKVTAKISKTSVDKIMESIQVNAGTESGMDISDTTNTSMALSLGVDTTAQTATSVVYEISMTATITYTKNPGTSGAETKQTTADVSNVDDYVTAVIKMQKGLESVVVKHDGKDMTSGAVWAEKVGKELTVENFVAFAGTESNPDAYGYYYYVDGTTDSTLYIKTKSFSPFEVSYVIPPKYVAISGGVLYKTLEGDDGAIAKATEGATITLLCDVDLSNLSEQIVVSKILTIETNGNTLKGYSYIKGDFDVSSTQETPDYTKDFYCDNTGMDSDKGIIRIKRCEARIGERRYRFITEAFVAAATDGKTVTTITVNGDAVIKGNAGITIGTTQKIELDLNGYTVKNAVNEDKESQVLKNEGTLTIMDSTDTDKDGTGNGKLFNSFMEGVLPGEWWSDPKRNYASNVITNCGTLTVKSGTILQTAAGSICYAVDNNSTNRNTTLNVEGGIITDLYGTAVRMFCNSTVNGNTLHMTGGEISAPGYTAFWIQLPGSSAISMKKATLSIKGGTVSGGTYAFYDYSYGDGWDNVSYEITGGTFIGFIYSYELEGFISGGLFSEDPSYYVDKSCAVRMNDSMYEVYRPTYTDDFGVVYSKSDASSDAWDVLYDGSELTVPEYTIPEGVKYIDDWAFYYCDTLQSISFPSTMREIGTNAFESATKLKNVYLNEGLLRIGERAFKKCSSLKTLGNETIGIPSTVVYIGNSAFQSCSSWTDSIVIPEGVNMAAEPEREGYNIPGWFCGCSSITSITIPENAEIIAKDMFRQTGITSITIPAKVREIGEYVFRDCENLTSIIVNIDGTKDLSISKNAFANMASPYPTTTMDIYNHDVYTYVTTLGLSSASYITFVDKNPQTTTQVESN